MNIAEFLKTESKILVLGNYPLIQPVLDFDFLSGKKSPSVVAIIASGRNFSKFFWGEKEIVIPVYDSLEKLPTKIKKEVNLFLNLNSGRRVLDSSIQTINYLPNLKGGVIFAEDSPEKFSLKVREAAEKKGIFVIGPSSVGLLIPGVLKIGAIGGVRIEQLTESKLFTHGRVAVFSSSGGMTNELINVVTKAGHRISFALSFGGDRFPIFTPKEAFIAAEKDKNTDFIVYFGELGGYDEYEIIELIKTGKLKKKVIAYIAGVIGDAFDKPTQFGHAKALAKKQDETAAGKRASLKKAGVIVPESFSDFVKQIEKIKSKPQQDVEKDLSFVSKRKNTLFTSSIVNEVDGEVYLLGNELLKFAKSSSFSGIAGSMFLGKNIKSKELIEFIDLSFKLLVDHGAKVSGAVNTMITARAGKDLISSLVTGLLTIGPRFGGAINEAAKVWLSGVEEGLTGKQLVEKFVKAKEYIPGIGHRKYRLDFPDPRVKELQKFATKLNKGTYIKFAKSVEKVTTSKKGNLILNVDGTIAAMLLDLLREKEGLTPADLKQLTQTEFFNAFFVLPRTVGFISHYLDQKRLDEGLFRLPDDMLSETEL